MNEGKPPAFCEEAVRLLQQDFLPRLRACVESLSEEEIWWRPNQNCNSVGNLLLHLDGNLRQWIIAGVGGKPDIRLRDEEFAAREGKSGRELLATLEKTLAEACREILKVPVNKLQQARKIQVYQVTILQAVFHVVEHFSHHLGQVIYLTKSVQDVDLQFYAGLNSKQTRFDP